MSISQFHSCLQNLFRNHRFLYNRYQNHHLIARAGGRWALFIDFQQNGVVKSLRDSKGNCASCIRESEKGKRETSPFATEMKNLLPFSRSADRSVGSCRSGDSSRSCRARSPRSCLSSGSPNILRSAFASSSSASRACLRLPPC